MSAVVYRYEIPDPARRVRAGALVPFVPAPLAPGEVVGRRIAALSTHVGTYGMGGPGFFGLCLGEDWLVVAVWGAAAWMHVEGRLVEDLFHADHGRPAPWIHQARDDLSPRCVGRAIRSCEVERHALRLAVLDGPELRIDASAGKRPAFEGDGSPRAFAADDDLRRAVFLSPTAELWV